MGIEWSGWVCRALCVGCGCVVSSCAAEGALANAMIIQGDAEGSLVKMTADGLPVCDPVRDGAVFYVAQSDELVFCSSGEYQSLGQGVCDGPADASLPEPDASVVDAGDTVPCTLMRTAEGAARIACEDGTAGELVPAIEDDAGHVEGGIPLNPND